ERLRVERLELRLKHRAGEYTRASRGRRPAAPRPRRCAASPARGPDAQDPLVAVTSRERERTIRRLIQRTASSARNARSARLQSPYLERPSVRGRWCTGTSTTW